MRFIDAGTIREAPSFPRPVDALEAATGEQSRI
jgi:hypothetical protein